MKTKSFKTTKQQLESLLPNLIKFKGNDCILHINKSIKIDGNIRFNNIIKISYIDYSNNKFNLNSNSQIHMYFKLVDERFVFPPEKYNINVMQSESVEEIVASVNNTISSVNEFYGRYNENI